jgi:predicted secreted protein
MLNKILFIAMILISSHSFASQHQHIDTLGLSPKGQYVALEEYGYKSEVDKYYVVIKIMNVWKKEYVGTPIMVELAAEKPTFLAKAREKAKELAAEQLKEFNIRG